MFFSGSVKTVAISADSKLIASGSFDKTIRIWQTSDTQLLHCLKGHTKSVEVIRFSPNSELLCSGSWDRTAIIWQVEVSKQ